MTVPDQKQFTTGEVARIAQIGEATVRRCMNDKSLKVITIPGSRHRRVTRASLIKFLKAMGYDDIEETP
jgi:hypothetical protein